MSPRTLQRHGSIMVWTTECVVDILRRGGPGALSTERLTAELRRSRPPVLLTRERLEYLIDESDGRVALIEVRLDDPERTVVESWVFLTDPRDRPSRPAISAELWRSLAALAEDLDTSSRVEVCRWILTARSAELACSIALGARPARPQRARRRPRQSPE